MWCCSAGFTTCGRWAAQVTADYPATFLSVGDADPFQYQFNFALPQARTAFQRTLAFLAQVTR